jgi:hypothetical protein
MVQRHNRHASFGGRRPCPSVLGADEVSPIAVDQGALRSSPPSTTGSNSPTTRASRIPGRPRSPVDVEPRTVSSSDFGALAQGINGAGVRRAGRRHDADRQHSHVGVGAHRGVEFRDVDSLVLVGVDRAHAVTAESEDPGGAQDGVVRFA